ncbi:MAG: hypothetical protein LBL74_03540 [Bacteroidales bacterium]|nr:hypothetical protein [Bacteroidales bacterium]
MPYRHFVFTKGCLIKIKRCFILTKGCFILTKQPLGKALVDNIGAISPFVMVCLDYMKIK